MPSQVHIRSSGFTWAMSAGDNKDDSWTLEVDLLRANWGGITRSNGKWSKEVAIMDNGLIGKWSNWIMI